MGIKMEEICVRENVDVESVFDDDHLPHDTKSEGEDGYWAPSRGEDCA